MMSPVILEMLADAHMRDIHDQVERHRKVERAGYRTSSFKLTYLLTTVVVLVMVGSIWIG